MAHLYPLQAKRYSCPVLCDDQHGMIYDGQKLTRDFRLAHLDDALGSWQGAALLASAAVQREKLQLQLNAWDAAERARIYRLI